MLWHHLRYPLPPFLLLYLIFCCAPSLLNAFTVIHADGSKEMCRSWAPGPLGTQVAWKSNPAVQQLYGALKDVPSRSDSLPASTATDTVISLVPMSKAHKQYDSGEEGFNASQMQPEPSPQPFHCTFFSHIAWYLLQEEQSRYENVAKWSADLMISIITCWDFWFFLNHAFKVL